MNNYIIFLFLSITSVFLIKKLYDKNESFKINDNDKQERMKQLVFELKQKKMKYKDEKKLRNIKDDSSLFSQFCKKIKYFDDNYDPSSKLKMFTKYSKQHTIHKLNKKQNKLLKEVFDLQEKIYYNTADIENHKKYEALIDNKTKQYIMVIDKAIANLKKNLNSKLILNINK